MSNLALSAVAEPSSALSILLEAYERGRRRQPVLWGMAAVMALLMVPTFAAYVLDSRTVNGIDVWTKPLKFELSLVFFLGTLAWFWGYLPAERQRGRVLGAYALTTAVLVFLEVVYMIVQSGRGVASHFNQSTPLEGILFTLMGIAALIFTLFPVALGMALARSGSLDLPPAFRLSVVLGLILTFALGGVAGMAIRRKRGALGRGAAHRCRRIPGFRLDEAGRRSPRRAFLRHPRHADPAARRLVHRPVAAEARPARCGSRAAALSALTIYALVEALSGRPFLPFIG